MHSIMYVIQYFHGEDSSNAMMNLSDAKSSVTQNSICHCVVCVLHFCSVWIIIDGNVMFIVLFIMLTTCTNTHFEYILSWMVFILPNGKTSALNQIKWKSPTKSQYVKKLYSVFMWNKYDKYDWKTVTQTMRSDCMWKLYAIEID